MAQAYSTKDAPTLHGNNIHMAYNSRVLSSEYLSIQTLTVFCFNRYIEFKWLGVEIGTISITMWRRRQFEAGNLKLAIRRRDKSWYIIPDQMHLLTIGIIYLWKSKFLSSFPFPFRFQPASSLVVCGRLV